MVLTFYHFLFCGWILESLKITSKSLETPQKWPNESSLLKKLSSEYLASILLHLLSLPDFTYMAFKDLLCGTFVDLNCHHIASESLETFHTSPHHCRDVKNLSLDHWWCTGLRFLEFTYGSNIVPLSFMWLNSWKFENCIEIAWNSHEWANRSSLLKRLSSEYAAYIVLHLQSLQDFTYMAFKDLRCGTFFVESHHNTSESVETFHTSPNHCLEVKKLSLGQWWCMVLTFYHFLLCGWILESLKIASKSLEILHKWPNESSLLNKLSSEYLACILLHLLS